ncbi:MAG: HAMP domain-containing sensor histidine kinase [Chloroflexota bacterium]
MNQVIKSMADIATSHNQTASSLLESHDLDASWTETQKALTIVQTTPHKNRTIQSIKADSFLNLANISLQKGEYRASIRYADDAISIFSQLENARACLRSLLVKQYAHVYLENHAASLQIGLRILTKSRIHKAIEIECESTIGIGACYLASSRWADAKEHFLDALKISNEIGADDLEPIILDYLANSSLHLGEYLEVIQYGEYALTRLDPADPRISRVNNTLAEAHYLNEQPERAAALLSQTLAHDGLKVDDQLKAFELFGKIVIQEKRFEEARSYFLRGLLIAEEQQQQAFVLRFHKNLSSLFKEMGDFQKGFYHLESYYSIRESIKSQKEEEQYQALELLYRIQSAHSLNHALKLKTKDLEKEMEDKTEALSLLARQLKHADRQETKLNDLRSKIIEIVSHELRTPIAVIQTSFDLLQMHGKEIPQPKEDQIYGRINNAIQSLTSLAENITWIDSIDDISRSEETQYTLNDLQYLLQRKVKQFCSESRVIKWKLPQAESFTLLINGGMFDKVISILIKNSCIYSDPNDPISIKLENELSIIKISICDIGIGIPKDDHEHIWDLFGRGRNVENRRGVGLGLYLAKSITRSLGGELSALSEGENKGATFTLTVPSGATP